VAHTKAFEAFRLLSDVCNVVVSGMAAFLAADGISGRRKCSAWALIRSKAGNGRHRVVKASIGSGKRYADITSGQCPIGAACPGNDASTGIKLRVSNVQDDRFCALIPPFRDVSDLIPRDGLFTPPRPSDAL